jgi:hypothetical protein
MIVPSEILSFYCFTLVVANQRLCGSSLILTCIIHASVLFWELLEP